VAIDLQGLDDFNPSSLMGKSSEKEGQTGILTAPIEAFHEDPNNPRRIYKEEALQELVKSIESVNPNTGKARGVMQPLSVCDHPTIKGEFQINGGSRRLRAAKIAGIKELPYFVDNDAEAADKVVDNLIREGFELVEMAEFIKARIEEGLKAGEIAESLGKKAAYVSDYLTYWLLSDSIKKLLDKGYTSSIQVLSTLHRASKKHPEEVDVFCKKIDSQVTYSKVIDFVASLKENKPSEIVDNPVIDKGVEDEANLPDDQGEVEDAADQILDNDKEPTISKPVLIVEHDSNLAELLIKKVTKVGFGWIKYEFDGSEIEVNLDSLKLVKIGGK
jgi:ParB family chromosome partitioning protein